MYDLEQTCYKTREFSVLKHYKLHRDTNKVLAKILEYWALPSELLDIDDNAWGPELPKKPKKYH